MDSRLRHIATACDLPSEVITIILLSLPTQSIAKFRFVCRLWNQLITSDPLFQARLNTDTPQVIIQKIHPRQPSTAFIDLFIVPENDEPMGQESIRIPNRGIPSLRLFSSCNDLLSFNSKRGVFSLCNPLLGEWIDIPEFHPQTTLCGFYHHKGSNQYRLMGVLRGAPHYRYEIFTLGSESWRSIHASSDHAPNRHEPPVILNNSLYWLAKGISEHFQSFAINPDCDILVFDMEAETFRLMHRPHGSLPLEIRLAARRKLIEIDGLLTLCQLYTRLQTDIWMLKDHENEASWEKKYIISTSDGNWDSGTWMWYRPLNDYENQALWSTHIINSSRPVCALKGEVTSYNPLNHGFISYNILLHGYGRPRISSKEEPFVLFPPAVVYKRSNVSLLALNKRNHN